LKEAETKKIIARSVTDFFEQYNKLIKSGWTVPHQGVFEMQVNEGLSVNFWNVDMVFDVQQYLDIGLENLPWEDLKALAHGVGAKIESAPATVNNVRKILGEVVDEPEPAPHNKNQNIGQHKHTQGSGPKRGKKRTGRF